MANPETNTPESCPLPQLLEELRDATSEGSSVAVKVTLAEAFLDESRTLLPTLSSDAERLRVLALLGMVELSSHYRCGGCKDGENGNETEKGEGEGRSGGE